MSNEETIEIKFINNVSHQTHVFNRIHLQNNGFFEGLISHSMKESTSGKAEIHFSNGPDDSISHPVHFVFMENIFQNLEVLFKDGNFENIPISGELLYQFDKLLQYFLCPKYNDILLIEVFRIFTNMSPKDITFAMLVIYDRFGKEECARELVKFYSKITSIEKEFIPFFESIQEAINSSEYYTNSQKIDILQLSNRVRHHISRELLSNQQLSDMLLMESTDFEEYFHYEPMANTTMYFPTLTSPMLHTNVMVSQGEALLRFSLMTQGALKEMPWDNVCLAGGCVNLMLDATLQPSQFPASDIDIFIYGQTADERKKAVHGLLNYFHQQVMPKRRHFYIVRGSVVSIYIDDCPTVFQIVCGSCKTILETVHNFDLTHLRVALQKETFYLTLEAAESMRTKTSYVHGYGTKSLRIWKAVNRGYNIVDNGALVLDSNNSYWLDKKDIDKYREEPNPVNVNKLRESSNELIKITLEELEKKFQYQRFKYYYPRVGEVLEHVFYELKLHTGCKIEEILTDILKVKTSLVLEGAFHLPNENSYFGKFLDINIEKVQLDHIPSGNYLRITVPHKDSLGISMKHIGFRTPKFTVLPKETVLTGSRSRRYHNELVSDLSSNIMILVNEEFLQYVKFLSDKLYKRIFETDNGFSKLFKKHANLYRYGISDFPQYDCKLLLKEHTMLVKVKPNTTRVYLKNRQILDIKQSSILLIRGLPKIQYYADIVIDKFWWNSDFTVRCFVYNIKNLYLTEDIDPSIYQTLPTKAELDKITQFTDKYPASGAVHLNDDLIADDNFDDDLDRDKDSIHVRQNADSDDEMPIKKSVKKPYDSDDDDDLARAIAASLKVANDDDDSLEN